PARRALFARHLKGA
ncbi:hypothetical protein GQR86_04005, partial [Providencia vermicola]|nr:hypothetical protein [Providencia vermicola]